MENVLAMLQVLLEDWQNVILGGIMLACSVIFLMGIGKTLGLDRVKNKHLKKAILYFGSMAMVIPTTALYFIIEGISFDWYWWACIGIGILTTITYGFYENSGLRIFIHYIGKKTVGKLFGVIWFAFGNKLSKEETIHKLVMTTNELKEEIRSDLKGRTKDDFDLNDL